MSSWKRSIPLQLLVNIDNFAHAVKLTWQTEDNVIAVLQSLGASTFLALLERSHLMDTLTRQGDRLESYNLKEKKSFSFISI